MHENIYDEDPVFYCAQCLSLRVLHIPHIQQSEYCDVCGSTNIKEEPLEKWESKYFTKYRKKFIKNGEEKGRE